LGVFREGVSVIPPVVRRGAIREEEVVEKVRYHLTADAGKLALPNCKDPDDVAIVEGESGPDSLVCHACGWSSPDVPKSYYLRLLATFDRTVAELRQVQSVEEEPGR
jgi:hypothetical protein